MRFPLSRAFRLVFAAVLPLLAGACIHRLPDAAPGDIPALRAQLTAEPNNTTVGTKLGIALYKDGQHKEAVAVLAPVVQAGEPTGAANLYLGLANEELQNWDAARDAYTSYISAGRFNPVKDQLRGRLALIVRRQIQDQAKTALAQEAQLSAQPPTVRSVAVFPFRLVSDNAELEPLEVALADMMITDLQLSGGLTVLERTQVQSLLDEMALSDAGYVDQGSGTRAGHLLRAEHVVQGALTTLGTEQIRFDADVLETQRGSSAGNITNEQQIATLFDMEKVVVFQVLDILGVELTPAEREQINQNRAENLLSFLAYGRGLQSMDRGDYASATQFFDQAIRLDPGFQPARDLGGQAGQMGDAATTSTTDVAASAAGSGTIGAPPDAPAPGVADVGNTLANVDNGVNPSPTAGTIDVGSTGGSGNGQQTQQRDPVQESQGSDGVTKNSSAKIVIQIKRPGT